ncbi:uncharacterized protein LOC112136592 isoform X2 [Oryzias melastigma]|uniref:uncharacterized protein LOC112136592 isoform X2 n=1 Tax=Oryzias melastigma TaxID=30732 RepID=UPI00168D7EAF|nr:uncharacterized protein LOC112136592 isoform X2 [Oryzias melastigma]
MAPLKNKQTKRVVYFHLNLVDFVWLYYFVTLIVNSYFVTFKKLFFQYFFKKRATIEWSLEPQVAGCRPLLWWKDAVLCGAGDSCPTSDRWTDRGLCVNQRFPGSSGFPGAEHSGPGLSAEAGCSQKSCPVVDLRTRRPCFRSPARAPRSRTGVKVSCRRTKMDSSEPDSLHLRGSTAVSLNQRFTQLLTRSTTAAQPPPHLRRRRGVFRLLRVGVAKRRASLSLPRRRRRRRRRRSVWTRLGWTCHPCTTPGFWSFRNKYRWGARFTIRGSSPGEPPAGRGQERGARHPEEEDCPINGAAAVAPPPRETAIVKSNGLSDSTCGTMGSSVPSEEDHEEAGPDRSGSTESCEEKRAVQVSSPAYLLLNVCSAAAGGGGVLQGKRAKKTVERLDLQAPKQKEKLRMGDGKLPERAPPPSCRSAADRRFDSRPAGAGDKLGDIPRTSYQINRMKAADLKPLHSILYDRPGKVKPAGDRPGPLRTLSSPGPFQVSTMKRNLRLFNGFPFQADSEQFHRKRDKLLKSSSLSNSKLKLVCTVLDLEKKGTHSDLIHRILGFLLSPKNSGKRLPVKKRRRSKKKLTGEDSKKKSRPRERSSCTPKKSRTRSKSSAIVMDSSSDDEDEKTAAAAAQSDGEDEEERRSETSEDEEQSSRSESDRAKKKTATSQETPTKKKRMKKRSLEELQPRKKKAAPLRPAAKVKKADSSRASNTAADSSDDDQPLIKMMKTSVSDEKLKETLQTLLRDADLGEMTMKKICQQVFDMFPEHDLSSRKDFIKQTVKDIIT